MRCCQCGSDEFYEYPTGRACKRCARSRANARYWKKREQILAAERAQRAMREPREPQLQPKICPLCSGEFAPRSGFARFCDVCRPAARRLMRQRWNEANPEKVKAAKAGSYQRHRDEILAKPLFAAQRAAAVDRARRWAVANPERSRAHARTKQLNRRARKHAGFIERVDAQRVYEMHGGRCGVCGLFIDGDFHVDHAIPLSRGGQHGYVNVQPAHPRCNASKGAKAVG